MKKITAIILSIGMLFAALPGYAEEGENEIIESADALTLEEVQEDILPEEQELSEEEEGIMLQSEPVLSENGLLFDLDLSEYTSDNPIVKNAVTESTDEITVYGRGSHSAPESDFISSMNGETRYITMGKTASKGEGYGVIQLGSALAAPMAQSDELTVEFWTKSDKPVASYLYYKFFKLSQKPYAGSTMDDTINWEVSVQSASLNAENRYARNTTTATDYAKASLSSLPRNTWTHYMLTRKYNADSDTYTSEVYINGVKKQTATGGKKIESNEYGFTIGGSGAAERTYQGSFGEFKVYLKVLDADTAKNHYLNTKNNYSELPKSMTLLSPTDDFEIGCRDGRLSIEFDNFFESAELDKITFTEEDGSEIPGGVFKKTESQYSKKAELSFGRLKEDSAYRLHIGSITSVNGYSSEERDIIVTTGNSFYINEDFESYPIGPAADIAAESGLTFFSSGVNNSAADFNIREKTDEATGEKKKYMEMKNGNFEASFDSYLAYTFPEKQTKDFVVEVGVRGDGGAALNRSIRFADGGFGIVGEFGGGADISSGGAGIKKTIKAYSSSSKDKFGFLNMIYIFRMNEEGTYTVTGTSPENPDVDYEAITTYSAISQIRINQYNKGSDSLVTNISHLKIYEYNPPEIIADNISEINKDSDFIELSFSDDMTGFSEKSLVLSKIDEEGTVKTEFIGYDEETRTAKLKINEYLDYGKRYLLSVSGIKSTDGTPMDSKKIEFRVPDCSLYPSVIKDGDTLAASCTNNSDEAKTALITVVFFDEGGRIICSESKKDSVSVLGSMQINISIAENAKKASVCVFELTDGEYRAVSSDVFRFEF